MSNLTGFPIEVQLAVGRYQDCWHVFARRDPANPRFEVRKAGEMALHHLDDLIDHLVAHRGRVGREVDDYVGRFRP